MYAARKHADEHFVAPTGHFQMYLLSYYVCRPTIVLRNVLKVCYIKMNTCHEDWSLETAKLFFVPNNLFPLATEREALSLHFNCTHISCLGTLACLLSPEQNLNA